MQTEIRKRIVALNERASQRRNSFPTQKEQRDVQIEHDLFDEMKEQMYKQIAEDTSWNLKEGRSII